MIQLIVIAQDYRDEETAGRRIAWRESHCDYMDKLQAAGKALIDIDQIDAGREATGSVLLFQVKDRTELDQLLAEAPYIKGRVWAKIDILAAELGATFWFLTELGDKSYWFYKKQWRLRWLTSLGELSGLKTQQERWLNPLITNPHWSFTEFVGCYFDLFPTNDHSSSYQAALEKGFLSQAEFECVQDIHAAVTGYKPPNGYHDHAAILKDDKWLALTSLGVRTCRALDRLLSDPQEKESLFHTPSPLQPGDFTWPSKPEKLN